jgi:hypothetical protein
MRKVKEKTHPHRHCEVATEAMNCIGRQSDRSNLNVWVLRWEPNGSSLRGRNRNNELHRMPRRPKQSQRGELCEKTGASNNVFSNPPSVPSLHTSPLADYFVGLLWNSSIKQLCGLLAMTLNGSSLRGRNRNNELHRTLMRPKQSQRGELCVEAGVSNKIFSFPLSVPSLRTSALADCFVGLFRNSSIKQRCGLLAMTLNGSSLRGRTRNNELHRTLMRPKQSQCGELCVEAGVSNKVFSFPPSVPSLRTSALADCFVGLQQDVLSEEAPGLLAMTLNGSSLRGRNRNNELHRMPRRPKQSQRGELCEKTGASNNVFSNPPSVPSLHTSPLADYFVGLLWNSSIKQLCGLLAMTLNGSSLPPASSMTRK